MRALLVILALALVAMSALPATFATTARAGAAQEESEETEEKDAAEPKGLVVSRATHAHRGEATRRPAREPELSRALPTPRLSSRSGRVGPLRN